MSRVLPILFNAEMVRAILDGRKTVTRRAMKPQPLFYTGRNYIFDDDVCPKKWEDCDNIIKTYQYQPGDILYVRETWCSGYDGEDYFYLADKNTEREQNRLIDYDDRRWRPSIHMPKEAARIWLKVTDLRVERLQGITEEQAVKEGIACVKYDADTGEEMSAALDWFPILWDSTIKETDLDRYGWNVNPWVWVIEFERCEKPEN